MALLFSMILKTSPPPPPTQKKRKEKRKHSKMGGSRGTCNREKMPIPGAHNLGGGGSLVIFEWGCAAGTLAPLVYTRACSREFCYPSTRLNSPNPHPLPILE